MICSGPHDNTLQPACTKSKRRLWLASSEPTGPTPPKTFLVTSSPEHTRGCCRLGGGGHHNVAISAYDPEM